MKRIVTFLVLIAMVSQGRAAYNSKEIEFTGPTIPVIERPACAKVEILKKVTMPGQPASGIQESFQFTYMVTLEQGCQGTLTLTSTIESSTNHHTETIKESYLIKDGALIKQE